MVIEQEKRAERAPEIRDIAQGNEQRVEIEGNAVAQEGNVEAAVAERRRAAENAARTHGEMKDQLLVRVESLLSEGLADEYAALSKDQKDAFRKEGETLALWLHGALSSGSVKPHKVLDRLERWLLIIEGKDRHAPWLIQEAYIRARRVLQEEMYNEKGH